MPPWEFELRGGRRLTVGPRALIAGIINCTPDSFSDGGCHAAPEAAIEAGCRMVEAGADWLDVGGESTRPGAQPVPPGVQLERILDVIAGLRARTDAIISVDTMSPVVARKAFAAGADVFNDVSSCRDPGWADTLKDSGAPIVLMHMKGTPLTMQIEPEYPGGVVSAVLEHFVERLATLASWGVPATRTILDPGLGFGKRAQHNLELIRSIEAFSRLGRPIFIGASRKGFLEKVLAPAGKEVDAEVHRDVSTLIVNAMALFHGAHILRVHHVPFTKALLRLREAVAAGESWTREGEAQRQ
jgi:dihydropteroate synthase